MNDGRSDLMKSLLGAAIRGVLFGLLLVAVFAAGFAVRGTTRTPLAFAQGGDYPILSDVHTLLEQNYLNPLPDAKELEYAAIKGMVGALEDPHTYFIPPAVAKNESDALAGEYGGIGAEVKRDTNGDYVLYPYPDSPAAAAGIRDSDKLLAVGDTEVTPDMLHDDVRRLVRDEVGKMLTITVQHQDTGEIESFDIEVAVIQVPSVIWSTLAEAPEIGYIQVLRFTSRTPEELEQALVDLDAKGVVALVMDLRRNSGGLLQEAVDVASVFLDGGVVLYERRKGQDEIVKEAAGGGTELARPLAVLVDDGSASAAELVAGALQDRGRAVLIGQKTYGKGSVQLIFTLADGSSLHVTTAEWYTPDRHAINAVGLTPDIEMIHSPDFDAELSEAVRWLRAQVAVTP
ncbi:MAG: S41 family peptidase [Anaerolineae bacterium]|nr:S41 family peptidase [Anaerolineae bacterium]